MLSEGAGALAVDWSGRKNAGTLQGFTGSMRSSGLKGRTLTLNGTSQWVSVGNDVMSTINGGTAITITGWFKGTNSQSFVRLQDNLGSNGYVVFPYKGGGATRGIVSTDGGTIGLNFVANIEDGAWHFIAMTWKTFTTNGWVQYVDGKVDSQQNSGNVTLQTAGTTGPYFGVYGGGPAEFTNGSLSNIRIYNRVLSAQEIRRLYVNPFAGVLLPGTRFRLIPGGAALGAFQADSFENDAFQTVAVPPPVGVVSVNRLMLLGVGA